MCGIAGIVGLDGRPAQEQELRAMCRAIVHRGPDDEGHYLDAHAGIAMRRLSIIDVAGGHQPIHNEDRSVWAVFNGEIYNFAELRRGLLARGHAFLTNTDTEVIVHLYEEHGPRCVEFLRGMFAFAVWDARKQKLLLARDRLGIKPLFYAEAGGRLIFASELKAILQLPEFSCDLNWESVSHLFTFLTTPPAKSIVDGIHKLEPGHILTASRGRSVQIQRYWNVEFQPDYGKTEARFVEETRELLSEAVRSHMVSDVPVGAFLSGGVDSSAVVAAASRIAGGPLQTFSIGFREKAYDESPYAKIVAQQFGAEHHELILGPDALDELDRIIWHLDEPFGDSSAIPTYMVSKLAARHVKVVLSGDGGDELFAGYERYWIEKRERATELPPFLRRFAASVSGRMRPGMRGRGFLRHRSLAGVDRYLDSVTLFRRGELQSLLQPECARKLRAFEPVRDKARWMQAGGGHWLSRIQELDFSNYLPLDILTKVDRMSMAHSLETRVPLLDHKLVEFAATIPPEMTLRGGAGKRILKQAVRGTLPAAIIDRPKHGFAVPLGYWFGHGFGDYVRDVLLGRRARERGIFAPAAVETLINRHEQNPSLDLHIWTLLSFELWMRAYSDVRPGVEQFAVA